MAVKPKSDSNIVTRYGTQWEGDDLQIELECIRKGGHWIGGKGQCCGQGLFQHYMAARKLMWPDRYRHRWTDLMYENFIGNDVTILLGCASSQKTSHAVEYSCISYVADPENTLCVLSTTTMDKLDIGVWAELTMLWSDARKRHPDLPGHIINYKRAISTDDIDEGDTRDMRRGIICRPCKIGGRWVGLGTLAGVKQENIIYVCDELQFMDCFPKGTLVDTPSGRQCIESINIGDEVLGADGPHKVVGAMKRNARVLVRIKSKDGQTTICTPNHPFFTHKGWIKACNLTREHYMMSPYETMRILQGRLQTDQQSEGVRAVSISADESPLPTMWACVQEKAVEFNCSVLQSILRREMEVKPTGYSSEDFYERTRREALQEQISNAQGQAGACGTIASTAVGEQLYEESDYGSKGERCNDSQRLAAAGSRRERDWPNEGGESYSRHVLQVHQQLFCDHWENSRGVSVPLQSGCGVARNQTGNLGRWRFTQFAPTPGAGCEKDKFPHGSWVDSVEIYKPESSCGHTECQRGIEVYNLEVEGHPSYSVNGFLVHNCAFSGSWPHLFSNGNVKIIGSGNPKHDPDDQLSITACPIEGWAAMREPTKTSVWPTKFMGAKCVNLVGTDSPNFDVPRGTKEPYRKLIGRKFEERMAHDHGRDSFEYYRLVKGVMKVAFALSRVITRQLCQSAHAMEDVTWIDDKQTRLYALDPSYGGEDRCVGGPLKFGRDVDGNEILLILPYRVFPISLQQLDVSVEDQIAETLAEELKTYDVPPENVFYDACGKGTIGAAFARKFGFRAPVAVDSGAQPTKRPARADLFVDEYDDYGKRVRRPKRCDEHYSKFVSEMWFSVRYAIEAGQVRGLLEDVMNEGCARIYNMVAGNKIEVEPKSDPKKKEDLKRRLGKSPDLFDYLAIGVEGARRLGFTIGRLGSDINAPEEETEDFFETERKLYEDAIKKGMLTRE